MSHFEGEMWTRLVKALEQMVKDNREFIGMVKEREERLLEIQESQLRMAQYYWEQDRAERRQGEDEE